MNKMTHITKFDKVNSNIDPSIALNRDQSSTL